MIKRPKKAFHTYAVFIEACQCSFGIFTSARIARNGCIPFPKELIGQGRVYVEGGADPRGSILAWRPIRRRIPHYGYNRTSRIHGIVSVEGSGIPKPCRLVDLYNVFFVGAFFVENIPIQAPVHARLVFVEAIKAAAFQLCADAIPILQGQKPVQFLQGQLALLHLMFHIIYPT